MMFWGLCFKENVSIKVFHSRACLISLKLMLVSYNQNILDTAVSGFIAVHSLIITGMIHVKSGLVNN